MEGRIGRHGDGYGVLLLELLLVLLLQVVVVLLLELVDLLLLLLLRLLVVHRAGLAVPRGGRRRQDGAGGHQAQAVDAARHQRRVVGRVQRTQQRHRLHRTQRPTRSRPRNGTPFYYKKKQFQVLVNGKVSTKRMFHLEVLETIAAKK